VTSLDTGKDKQKDIGAQTKNGLSVRSLMTALMFVKAMAHFRGAGGVLLEDVRQIIPFVLHDKLAQDSDCPFFEIADNTPLRTDKIGWIRRMYGRSRRNAITREVSVVTDDVKNSVADALLLTKASECPDEFLQVGAGPQGSEPIAILCDHMRAMNPADPPELAPLLSEVRGGSPGRMKLLAIVCWLLHDNWFVERGNLAAAMWKLMASAKLKKLCDLVKPVAFVHDADRREELTRLCLDLLGLRPRGETAAIAADRLTTLDSVERERILRGTAAAERRAREVREAMAKDHAQESASRYGE